MSGKLMLTAFGEGVGAQLALHRKPPCQKTKCPMLEEPTCLILGAGASAPYGLPTAAKLKQLILADVMESGRQAADEYPLRNPPYVVSHGREIQTCSSVGTVLARSRAAIRRRTSRRPILETTQRLRAEC